MTLSGPALDAAVERRLQRLVGRVVMVEGQVVAEQDEAVRRPPCRMSISAAACRCPRDGSRPASAACRSRRWQDAAWTALTSDDLPMPRAPHSSTLLAAGLGRSARCCRAGCRGRGRRRGSAPMSTRLTAATGCERGASACQTKQSAAVEVVCGAGGGPASRSTARSASTSARELRCRRSTIVSFTSAT